MARTKLTTKQKLEIINKNPILWLRNFVKIVNNDGDLVPFIVNKEQEQFINDMDKFNIILKSRQLGFSTLSIGLMLYYASIMPYSSYLILSYDSASLANLFDRLKIMYDSIPERFKGKEKRNNRNELVLANGSRISCKVAGNKELGRSFTCQIIHCSEFAMWSEEQQEKGLLGLEQALAKNADSKIIIESTANGIGNNFYNIFSNAEKERSKYKPFFFNWYSNKKQFDYEYRFAEQWYRSQYHGCRLQEKDLTPYELDLYQKGASLLQLMWRKWKMQDIPIEQFQQEYPATAEESFISTNIGVFDGTLITERYSYLLSHLNYKDIKPLPEVLLPYYGKGFFIYKDIKAGERYFGGIDTGAGLKQDYSSISILDSSGEQVAIFNRNDVPVYKFAQIAYELGMYFNYCMYLPERNSYGLDLITRLRKEIGYIQVLKIKKFDKVKGTKTWDYGFYTDNVSKTKLIGDFKEVFETGICLVNDKETLDQMRIYAEKDGKLNNIRGEKNHDDLVIATALAVQALKSGKSYV